jgi:hypothetical protein
MNTIVCGWHTPDAKYASLAAQLTAQLDALGQKHCFYVEDKPTGAGWQSTIVTIRPQITLRAMSNWPNYQILFLDVDAIVSGSLTSLFERLAHCDVAFNFRNKDHKGNEKCRLHPIGGVFLFNPTDRARRFAQQWADVCLAGSRTEETAVAKLISRGDIDVSIGVIPPTHGCYEPERAPEGAVITHRSAHKRELTARKRIEQSIRRAIRTVRPKRVEAA